MFLDFILFSGSKGIILSNNLELVFFALVFTSFLGFQILYVLFEIFAGKFLCLVESQFFVEFLGKKRS